MTTKEIGNELYNVLIQSQILTGKEYRARKKKELLVRIERSDGSVVGNVNMTEDEFNSRVRPERNGDLSYKYPPPPIYTDEEVQQLAHDTLRDAELTLKEVDRILNAY